MTAPLNPAADPDTEPRHTVRLLCAGGPADGTWRELELHRHDVWLSSRTSTRVGLRAYNRWSYLVPVHHEDGSTDSREVELLVWAGMSATDCRPGTPLERRLRQHAELIRRRDDCTLHH